MRKNQRPRQYTLLHAPNSYISQILLSKVNWTCFIEILSDIIRGLFMIANVVRHLNPAYVEIIETVHVEKFKMAPVCNTCCNRSRYYKDGAESRLFHMRVLFGRCSHVTGVTCCQLLYGNRLSVDIHLYDEAH